MVAKARIFYPIHATPSMCCHFAPRCPLLLIFHRHSALDEFCRSQNVFPIKIYNYAVYESKKYSFEFVNGVGLFMGRCNHTTLPRLFWDMIHLVNTFFVLGIWSIDISFCTKVLVLGIDRTHTDPNTCEI